ncbi:MAG: DUF4403 family protein [Saprospiraceae bacterium]|nr:DUF4403 family protein [Saprospiraceae bacterium]
MKNTGILILLAIGLLQSCKPSKLIRPEALYEDMEELMPSVLNVPIAVNLKELETSVNEQLQGTLYEDNDLGDGDRMMMRLAKRADIVMQTDSQKIKYHLPLFLWVLYDAGIARVEATGEIDLDMQTAISIDPDWNVQTQTEITGHRWHKSPRLKVGMVSLPVGFIADLVLKNSRASIARSIDEMVKKNFNLREIISENWEKLYQPFLVSPEYRTWLMMNPRQISMSPLEYTADSIYTTVKVESLPAIALGEEPDSAVAPPLPPLKFMEDAGNDFAFFIDASIPFTEAESLAEEHLLGETFSSGKRTATVEDLSLFGREGRLVVELTLSGSYNGNIYLSGLPAYNARKNTVEIEDIEFTLETRNFLHKTAAWLLKSTIRKRIEENMTFLLAQNLEDTRRLFQEQMKEYQISEGSVLRGELRELSIRNVFLTPEAMHVAIGLSGEVQVDITGF